VIDKAHEVVKLTAFKASAALSKLSKLSNDLHQPSPLAALVTGTRRILTAKGQARSYTHVQCLAVCAR